MEPSTIFQFLQKNHGVLENMSVFAKKPRCPQKYVRFFQKTTVPSTICRFLPKNQCPGLIGQKDKKNLRLEVGGPVVRKRKWPPGCLECEGILEPTSPLFEARRHPWDTLRSWGYKGQRHPTNPGPERGKEGRRGISHSHHHPTPTAPPAPDNHPLLHLEGKESERRGRDVTCY